ncbi:MAG: Type 1 glutamine amidotransferase-like domain-containing protein [Woeseiaceae bacterium]|nr:Type 1 glutamine amidotransferase-like domain-containing protein [Woeseiaceae bacterium]
MSTETPRRLLLGPQRPTINLGDAIEASGIEARSLAVISAGWQEAENDIDEIRDVVGLPLADLCLYGRTESLLRDHEDLASDYRARQDRLQQQQRLYRLRLKQLAIAARHTLKASGDADILAAEQRHAVAQLRALDRHHLKRTTSVYEQFARTWNTETLPAIDEHRREIADILDANDGVIITGGNIAILLNRLSLFGMADLLADRTIIAWSAGAMVLADRIVLFHDRMPQGRREPEVLSAGLGLVRGHVFLPDPTGRLRLRDRPRIGLMARRFAPDKCVTLVSGASVEFGGTSVVGVSLAQRLGKKGQLTRVRAA